MNCDDNRYHDNDMKKGDCLLYFLVFLIVSIFVDMEPYKPVTDWSDSALNLLFYSL